MALIRWDKCLFYFWSDFMVEVNAIAEKNLAPLKSEGFSVQYRGRQCGGAVKGYGELFPFTNREELSCTGIL